MFFSLVFAVLFSILSFPALSAAILGTTHHALAPDYTPIIISPLHLFRLPRSPSLCALFETFQDAVRAPRSSLSPPLALSPSVASASMASTAAAPTSRAEVAAGMASCASAQQRTLKPPSGALQEGSRPTKDAPGVARKPPAHAVRVQRCFLSMLQWNAREIKHRRGSREKRG